MAHIDRRSHAHGIAIARRLPAALKRLYPAIAVFAIFGALMLVTVALRLAIWLALYRH
jgi:hypothetical protein